MLPLIKNCSVTSDIGLEFIKNHFHYKKVFQKYQLDRQCA